MKRRKLLSTIIAVPAVAVAENFVEIKPVEEFKFSCSVVFKSDDHRFTTIFSGTERRIKEHILKRFRKSFKNSTNVEFGILVWDTQEWADSIVNGVKIGIHDFRPSVSKIKFGEEQISYLIDNVMLSHKEYLKNKTHRS